MNLSKEDVAFLVGMAKKIKRGLIVAKDGVQSNVIFGLNGRLDRHQLVKVGFPTSNPAKLKEMAEELANKTSSTVVWASGNEAAFFRRHPNRDLRDVSLYETR